LWNCTRWNCNQWNCPRWNPSIKAHYVPDGGFGDPGLLGWLPLPAISDFAGHVGNMEGSIATGLSYEK
jgi:hypothetical protein